MFGRATFLSYLLSMLTTTHTESSKMDCYTSKVAILDAMMSFAANCALVKVEAVSTENKIVLVACEVLTREHIARVLKARGLKRVCFRVTDRLDTERSAVFLFTAKGFEA